ncbi:MAG: PhnA protein [Chitinophagaceae bacterium]|nr:MAG: PhnA protein [Chitinophagaceae bacterium]
MKLEDLLRDRSAGKCELCGGANGPQPFAVPPQDGADAGNTVMLCGKCRAQVDRKEELDPAHWRVLSDTMWSEVPGVQVLAWRMLNRLRNESWAADLLDMLYLDEERLAWAKATGDHENDGSVDLHRDANGNQLLEGDNVVLIKSLDVKGSTLTAKLGTVVRNIRLVPDNHEQIEGRVEGQQIVILTKYVRRQG